MTRILLVCIAVVFLAAAPAQAQGMLKTCPPGAGCYEVPPLAPVCPGIKSGFFIPDHSKGPLVGPTPAELQGYLGTYFAPWGDKCIGGTLFQLTPTGTALFVPFDDQDPKPNELRWDALKAWNAIITNGSLIVTIEGIHECRTLEFKIFQGKAERNCVQSKFSPPITLARAQ